MYNEGFYPTPFAVAERLPESVRRVYRCWYKRGLLGVFCLAHGYRTYPDPSMPRGEFAQWRGRTMLFFLHTHELSGCEYGPQAASEHEFIVKNFFRWRIHLVAYILERAAKKGAVVPYA